MGSRRREMGSYRRGHPSAIGKLPNFMKKEIVSLGETTRATDDRLNALINVVERQISEGRNGKP